MVSNFLPFFVKIAIREFTICTMWFGADGEAVVGRIADARNCPAAFEADAEAVEALDQRHAGLFPVRCLLDGGRCGRHCGRGIWRRRGPSLLGTLGPGRQHESERHCKDNVHAIRFMSPSTDARSLARRLSRVCSRAL